MSIQEKFDLALKKSKKGDENSYYKSENVNNKPYYAYYTKEEWDKFFKGMSDVDKEAYKDGGGKELEEKKSARWGVWMPPKMASYASSSRFIYELLRGKGVVFEQKLPTSIPRSISNMDGYYPNREIFIEAKCHEIYSSPNPTYKIAYKSFYDGLRSRRNVTFDYKPTSEKNDSPIEFFIGGNSVEQFDIKQVISHILGIAYACKNGVASKGKKEKHQIACSPTFVYMLFNPKELEKYLSDADWEKIKSRFESEVNFINVHVDFFKDLFKYSLEYLEVDKSKIKQLASGFDVKVADQYTILDILK